MPTVSLAVALAVLCCRGEGDPDRKATCSACEDLYVSILGQILRTCASRVCATSIGAMMCCVSFKRKSAGARYAKSRGPPGTPDMSRVRNIRTKATMTPKFRDVVR